MTNKIYSLFNRLSLRHGSVCVYPTDQFAVKAVTNDYKRANLQTDLDEIELVHVADIDIETGVVQPVNHRIIPLTQPERTPLEKPLIPLDNPVEPAVQS